MQTRGELRIDPGQLGTDAFNGELGTRSPYTDPGLTRALLRKAAAMTAGLQARISLVAVHSVPFPADFRCLSCTHTFLVDQLTELAAGCPLPVNPQVVLARSRQEGFRYALHPNPPYSWAPTGISGAPAKSASPACWSLTATKWPCCTSKRKKPMLDVLFVLMTVAFFAISWAFVKGCEKL